MSDELKEFYISLFGEQSNTKDFNTMNEHGIIWKINKDILHPLGLALSRDINNFSKGCLVDTSGDFERFYYDNSNKRNEIKYNKFIENRVEILSDLINLNGDKNERPTHKD